MFEEFFIKYKIGLKDVEDKFTAKPVPMCRRIGGSVIVLASIVTGVMSCFYSTWYWWILLFIALVVLAVVNELENRKSKLMSICENYTSPKAEYRKCMLKRIIDEYKLDAGCVDRLIELARIEQSKSDVFEYSKVPIPSSGLAVGTLIYTVNRVVDTVNSEEMVNLAVIIMVGIVLAYSCKSLVIFLIRKAVCPDFFKYDELIFDLKQIDFCK